MQPVREIPGGSQVPNRLDMPDPARAREEIATLIERLEAIP